MADPRISEDYVLSHSELINQVEDQREVYNTALKDAWADFREELKALGLTGKEIAKEVADLKGAISDERMTQEERAKADDKEEGRASYRAILTGPRARARIREANTQPQPTKAAAQADGSDMAVLPSSVESEAAEISTPITPVQDAKAMKVDTTTVVTPEPAQEVQILRPGPDAAGSSNGRTAEFDSANAGSSPAPAPITTLRQPKPLRPHCLRPDNCGGHGRNHCWSCTQAAETVGAA